MKRIIALALAAVMLVGATIALASCNTEKKITIAVPNDTTNEARALLLLESMGYIKLREGAGITATKADIVENPYNIEIVEIEAANIPNQRQDVDYAIINSNYAISAGINPMKDALNLEGSYSAYANILSVKEGNENTDKIKALVAALLSQETQKWIKDKYNGAVIPVVKVN